MMTNKSIANHFRELAQLMELHQDNPFKIKSYHNAYMTLRKLDTPVADMDLAELAALKGVGKAIAEKIRELVDTGNMATLQQFVDKTPPGVRDMLGISGFGPKKILTVWQELGVETIGELLYAVNENRLIEVKGFGVKTQEDLKTKLAYFKLSQGQFLYATIEKTAQELLATLTRALPQARIAWTGALRRAAPTLDKIELLASGVTADEWADATGTEWTESPQGIWIGQTESEIPMWVYRCQPDDWGSKQFRYTAAQPFLQAFLQRHPDADFKQLPDEADVFAKAHLPYIPPALREDAWGLQLAIDNRLPELVQPTDIRGVIHCHTTYSDGIHTLEQMAEYAQAQGYAYIGITDHSKAAFYANGLDETRVLAQMAAIDQLNCQLTDFRILKGIECDILADGDLDYHDDLLAQFDFVIASVHSNLRMDADKANRRLIRAIENPYTHILGHPTGRLLLSRPGYPIDHRLVIDACAANRVAIELNASPYRLDLDWTWIPYALERGVAISINPDAHSREGIHDIYYGTLAAQKGGLTASQCLNARDVAGFLQGLGK